DNLEPVSLVTHATPDMMETIEKLTNLWDGPISLGIFIDSNSRNVLEYLTEIYRCDVRFRRKMSIHFAYRISAFQTDCPTVFIPKSKISCDYFLKNQETLRAEISAPFVLYPCSLMRNVARWGAKSDIHFIMDGDMIISEGMALKIKKIANKMIDGKSKNVLLVRRFENANGTVIPRSFEKLEEKSKIFFFRNVDWEPQPILHKNDPYNADYFPSRIKNVQSLIYKLCRANYTFHLLSHVFDVHEGIKTEDTKYSKAVADHQNIYARRTARLRYAEEMSNLYPDTWEKCGVFAL
ncbi:Protein CBG15885, partial [Caenorhabditis briggsae]